ncbi:MAG TPA: hypothetical protein VHW02_13820 [Rhizomicrobium sp.]|jgi:hypothetical protein|nr:hypothetical protein [Rhizomicrobium sp.]
MIEEPEAERTGPNEIRAEDFLPISDTLEGQVRRQVDFLTDAFIDSMLRATGRFDSPEADEPPPNPWRRTPVVREAPGKPALRRAAELRNAVLLSGATADLIKSYARLRGLFRQEFTVNHLDKTNTDKTGAKNRTRTTRLSGNFATSNHTSGASSAVETALRGLAGAQEVPPPPPPAQNRGSND